MPKPLPVLPELDEPPSQGFFGLDHDDLELTPEEIAQGNAMGSHSEDDENPDA